MAQNPDNGVFPTKTEKKQSWVTLLQWVCQKSGILFLNECFDEAACRLFAHS